MLSHLNYRDIVYGPCLNNTNRKDTVYLLEANLQNTPQIPCVPQIGGGWLAQYNEQESAAFVMFFLQNNTQYKSPPYFYNRLRFSTDIQNVNICRKDLLPIPQHKKATV